MGTKECCCWMPMASTATAEEIQKRRNTDCVYFLASPLTCRKGTECEYRHSESARLNPRDCWYWLTGSCWNPTCAFRHPPLKGFAETPSNQVQPPPVVPSVIPTSKANVTCYFYFNAFCNKGEQCQFSHSNDMFLEPTLPKTANEGTFNQLQQKKSYNENDTGPPSVEAPPNSSENISKELDNKVQCYDLLVNMPLENMVEEPIPPSTEESVLECEEPPLKSDDPGSVGGGSDGLGDAFSEQSSQELVKDYSGQDVCCESSPGFDVLVDDGAKHLAYEEDIDYQLVQERETENLHGHLLLYGYEGSARYDTVDYPDAGFLQDHVLSDSYDHFDNKYNPVYTQRFCDHSRERMLEQLFPQGRKPSQYIEIQDLVDLRHHLRKRRRIDSHHGPHGFQRHPLGHVRDSSRERIVMHNGFPCWARLPMEVRINMMGSSHGGVRSDVHENQRRGWLGHGEGRHTLRKHEREVRGRVRQPRRHFLAPEFSKEVDVNETKPRQAGVFTGPKSLAQIKEEKMRTKEDTTGFGDLTSKPQRRAATTEFEGPKPLSELLKGKRKSKHEDAEPDGCQPGMSIRNWYPNLDSRRPAGGYKHRFSDDEDAEYASSD